MKKRFRLIIELIVLIKVVENKSFSKAAKELKISISGVSKAISKLEQNFNCQLIRRNAHDFEITAAGRIAYEKAIEIYNSFYAMTTETCDVSERIHGVIKLSAPSVLCDTVINIWVWEYMIKNPDVKIILNAREGGSFFADSPEFDDVVIKSGFIDSPELIHKSLNSVPFGLYASPDYLHSLSPITHPEALATHHILKLDHPSLAFPMKMFREGNPTVISPESAVLMNSNNANSILNLARQGKGICMAVPEWMVARDVHKGDLVRILPEWELPSLSGYLVWRHRHYYSLLFRDFIKYIEQRWNSFFSQS